MSIAKIIALHKALGGSGSGGGTGGALIVTDTNGTLDKTWAEISAAAPLAWKEMDGGYLPLGAIFSEGGEYYVTFLEYSDPVNFHEYSASSESGYPTRLGGSH